MTGRGRVVVVGLGPAGPELLTAGTLDALGQERPQFLRTARHPAAAALAGARSFDHVYEAEPTFEAVYRRIVDELVDAATAHRDVLYAVPGSPRVLERSVDLLLARAATSEGDPGGEADGGSERIEGLIEGPIEVEVLPALSFADLAWVRLGVDPLEVGVRLVDAHRFAERAAGERGPLLVAHCHSRRVLSEVKLAFETDAPRTAVVLQRLGLADEAIFEVDWAELDRSFEPDHLTALFLPEVAAPVASELQRFATLVRTLRERCPWDREQTHRSLTRHLLEETYEVLEALDGVDEVTGEGYDHLEEELGDLLFQVVLHATLAAEQGAFTLADVARGIHDKLVGRHPHVFGNVHAADSATVLSNWEDIKREEKGRASVFDGIPAGLPALAMAARVQRKAASSGLASGLSSPRAAGAATPSTDQVRSSDELGAALFALVASARRLDVDPEAALRATTARFLDAARAEERRGPTRT